MDFLNSVEVSKINLKLLTPDSSGVKSRKDIAIFNMEFLKLGGSPTEMLPLIVQLAYSSGGWQRLEQLTKKHKLGALLKVVLDVKKLTEVNFDVQCQVEDKTKLIDGLETSAKKINLKVSDALLLITPRNLSIAAICMLLTFL